MIWVAIVGGKETIWVLFNRFTLRLVLPLIDTQHGLLDIELVHLFQGVGDVIIAFTHLGKVFEHILRRHLKHLPTLLVHQEWPNEVIKV